MRWGRDWRNSRRDWSNSLHGWCILVMHLLKQKQIKGLFSYNFHHLDKYTPDMANIHTCPTSISKTMESIKHGTNRIEPMHVSELVRTKNMDKTWPQVWLNSGLERKPMIEPCGWLKATFSTPTRNSWKTIKGTHQEIIADIEEKMRWGLDSSKAVKRVLPKHKPYLPTVQFSEGLSSFLRFQILKNWTVQFFLSFSDVKFNCKNN